MNKDMEPNQLNVLERIVPRDPYRNNRTIGQGQKVFNTIYIENRTGWDSNGIVLTATKDVVYGTPRPDLGRKLRKDDLVLKDLTGVKDICII